MGIDHPLTPNQTQELKFCVTATDFARMDSREVVFEISSFMMCALNCHAWLLLILHVQMKVIKQYIMHTTAAFNSNSCVYCIVAAEVIQTYTL
jgi:hypothetical protein